MYNSSDGGVLGSDGVIGPQATKEGVPVELSAHLTADPASAVYTVRLQVFAREEEDLSVPDRLTAAIRASDDRTKEQLALPSSLRGTPAPEEFAADAAVRPRTLAVRLRIGSRLADLAPTLDRGNRYDVSPTGAKRIRGRGRGVRGWLEDNRVGMNYSTLMRYMRLAVRLRALLELDARLPLEWLLPGAAASAEVPAALQGQYATAKRKLAHLMRAHWNFSRLQAHVDGALGLRRLPRPGRAKGQPLDGFLADNVRHELADFLQAGDLPPKLEALRRDALHSFMPGPDRPSSPLPSASPCV